MSVQKIIEKDHKNIFIKVLSKSFPLHIGSQHYNRTTIKMRKWKTHVKFLCDC